MNKSLIALVAGIVLVSGLIGYTVLGKEKVETHTAGDGHAESEHLEEATSVPHDDTGTAPHND